MRLALLVLLVPMIAAASNPISKQGGAPAVIATDGYHPLADGTTVYFIDGQRRLMRSE